jgi:hypothetical protein
VVPHPRAQNWRKNGHGAFACGPALESILHNAQVAGAADRSHRIGALCMSYPLTKAECNLKLAKGSQAILDLFQEVKHPYVFNPDRASYI